MKDFLFFNYDWVPNSTYLFRCFEASGYECDFVNEQTLVNFIPQHKYRTVIAYLHEPWQLPYINHLRRTYLQDSYWIQHDDTDEQHVQHWFDDPPDLIIQREVTVHTINPYNKPLYPQHFPIADIYRAEHQNKELDVVFIGTPSNPRRAPFVHKLIELSQTSLKHLRWGLMYQQGKNPELNIRAINNAKVGVNFPGNSYDSWRIWEYASAGCGILMPELPLKSVNDKHQPFDEYVRFDPDLSDLEEKIVWMLEGENWSDWGKKARLSYLTFHKPEKCFEHYHDIVIRHAPIQPLEPVHMSAEPFYAAWRKRPV
jgi:hypothetical protein